MVYSNLTEFSSVKTSTNVTLTAGNTGSLTINYTLDRTPTEVKFIPTTLQWVTPLSWGASISGTSVTVTVQVGCVFSSATCRIGGYLAYK